MTGLALVAIYRSLAVDERTWYVRFQTRFVLIFFRCVCAIYNYEIRFDFRGRSVGRGRTTMIYVGLLNDEKTVITHVTCEY